MHYRGIILHICPTIFDIKIKQKRVLDAFTRKLSAFQLALRFVSRSIVEGRAVICKRRLDMNVIKWIAVLCFLLTTKHTNHVYNNVNLPINVHSSFSLN